MGQDIDGAVLREKWDQACLDGARMLRRVRDQARADGVTHVADYLSVALDQLNMLHAMVNGHRNWPGRAAPGLIYDAPARLWREPYSEAGETLDRLTDLFVGGLGAPEWAWSKGMPPGWPITWRDRLRSYAPKPLV